jgi:hypothetical protein
MQRTYFGRSIDSSTLSNNDFKYHVMPLKTASKTASQILLGNVKYGGADECWNVAPGDGFSVKDFRFDQVRCKSGASRIRGTFLARSGYLMKKQITLITTFTIVTCCKFADGLLLPRREPN